MQAINQGVLSAPVVPLIAVTEYFSIRYIDTIGVNKPKNTVDNQLVRHITII